MKKEDSGTCVKPQIPRSHLITHPDPLPSSNTLHRGSPLWFEFRKIALQFSTFFPGATPSPAPHLVLYAIVVSISDSVIINNTPLRVYLGVGVPRTSFCVDPIDLLSITSTVFVPTHSNIGCCDDAPGVPPPSPEALTYQPAYARVGAFSSSAWEFIGDGPRYTTTHETTKTLTTIGRMSRYFGPVQTETTAFGGGPRRRDCFGPIQVIGIDATSSYLNLSPLYGINSKLVRPLGLKGFIPGKRELFLHTRISSWWSAPTGF
ncbi:hypothetical protein C8R44DRAFT_740526 [Mycena epipterygia]|nr:hypothetical protein C8R44DRAFT_740526 [Mycena epipterygia]